MLRLNRRRAICIVTVLLGYLLSSTALASRQSSTRNEQPSFTEASVIRVIDGDTLWVKPINQTSDKPYWRIRLHGIDAPESCQAHGVESTLALRKRVMQRPVRVTWMQRDVYGRWLARLHDTNRMETTDVGAWMVANGHAWSYQFKGNPGPYAQEEQRASAGKQGLFAAPQAMRPYQFRRKNGPCSRR